MTMITHTEQQGTSAWKNLRASHDTASEAPAMMGDSKYQSRDDLLSQKKYGTEKEISPHMQKLFDKGHAAEASIRPVIEKIIGKDLYPITGSIEVDGLKLLASFDGLTMLEDINFEHKLWNENLAQAVRDNSLTPHYYWQLEDQMLVSGAEKTIFVVSDGTEENMEYCWYEPVPGRAEQLIAGWKQFAIDLDSHEHIESKPKAVAEATCSLPSVSINVDGGIAIIDNLAVFGEALQSYVENINKEPETDQDFANLESSVKTLKDAENALNTAESSALSQAESIDAMRKTVDMYRKLARDNRLLIEKLVKAKKESLKDKIITDGKNLLLSHIALLKDGLDGYAPELVGDFACVVKGKKTMDSIRSSINDELARCKIIANEQAEIMRANLKLITDNEDYRFLFNDLAVIVRKDNADFSALVKVRINEHKEVEAKKAEKIKAAEAKKVEKKEDQPAASNDLSEPAQSFVNEIDGGEKPSIEPAAETVSAADQKQKAADIKKLKKYFERLSSYAVPAVKDKKCSAILKKAVEKIIEMQDYVDGEFPDNTQGAE